MSRRTLLGTALVGAASGGVAVPTSLSAASRGTQRRPFEFSAARSTPVPAGGLLQASLRQQLEWLVARINAGADALDPVDLEAHFTPALLSFLPPEVFGGYIEQFRTAFGTLEIQGVTRPPTDTQTVALLIGGNGGQMTMAIAIESELPHRIAGAAPYPVPTADGVPLRPFSWQDARHPDGGLLDNGERRLYLASQGQDTPTVVLEAGLGDSAAGWAAIEAAVSGIARVCSYDRANAFAGASDPAPVPRTGKDVVEDLHELLDAADIHGPVVLVGHSIGGEIARLYASAYPDDVAGLVLVDASHEEQDERLQELLTPEQRAFMAQVLASNPEGLDVAASHAEVRQARDEAPLMEMPLFVLTAGRSVDPATLPPDWPVEANIDLWNELQDDLAGLVPGARHIVAEQSGHYIHQSQPGLVVEAIRAVVDAVREPATWATPAAGTPAA